MATHRVRLKDESQSLPAKPQQSAKVRPELSPVKSQFSPVKPPEELAQFFADPPLVGNEKREEYERFFAMIAAAAKATDAISWLFVRDVTDLSWDIRRERSLKAQAIRNAQEEVVARLLTPPEPRGYAWRGPTQEAVDEAREWASDPKARLKTGKKLADWGYDETYILTEAYKLRNSGIDAFDARIASHEVRRMTALGAIELHSENLARRLEAVSSDVIEGEFTRASE
jgi:hypothetical protein